MPVYLVRPIAPSPKDYVARRFVCEDDPQALDLAIKLSGAGLTVEVWDESRLVGCVPSQVGASW